MHDMYTGYGCSDLCGRQSLHEFARPTVNTDVVGPSGGSPRLGVGGLWVPCDRRVSGLRAESDWGKSCSPLLGSRGREGSPGVREMLRETNGSQPFQHRLCTSRLSLGQERRARRMRAPRVATLLPRWRPPWTARGIWPTTCTNKTWGPIGSPHPPSSRPNTVCITDNAAEKMQHMPYKAKRVPQPERPTSWSGHTAVRVWGQSRTNTHTHRVHHHGRIQHHTTPLSPD